MSQNRFPVSYEGVATTNSGGIKIPLRITSKINYFINDDGTNDIRLNFNRSVGESGTITVKAGQGFSDLECSISSISVQAVAGTPAFRVLGV